MQLWVSKLNKNKWKITLIILSVALVVSCVFGVTTAWFNKVESNRMKVSMDMRYVNIFVDSNGDNTSYEMIPGQSITVTTMPKVNVNEPSGRYCVFVQVSELGGTSDHTYLEYRSVDKWIKLTPQEAKAFSFPEKEDTAYYYQLVDASAVQQLEVLDPTVTVTADTTYKQIKKAWENDTPVKLQVVAAGCKTEAQSGLPTAVEVAYAEVYTAFIG